MKKSRLFSRAKLLAIGLFCFVSLISYSKSTPVCNSYCENGQIEKNISMENEWQLVSTKDGVSCYSKVDNLGTGSGIFLRFVNNSGTNVTINWNVNDGSDISKTGTIALSSGQTVDSTNQPVGSDLLAIRIGSTKPVVSFTVSK